MLNYDTGGYSNFSEPHYWKIFLKVGTDVEMFILLT